MKKLSIVTVTYNAAQALEKTIQNIIAQSYFPYIEYIIIDGQSQDHTLEIIKQYEKYISYWVSEPDQGIYDAMNKGIQVAQGEWINFMNTGDIFTSPTTVEQVFQHAKESSEILYGNYVLSFENYKKSKYTPVDLHDFYKGMLLNHQSTFIRTGLAKTHLYNINFRFACDYEQLFYFYQKGRVFQHIDLFIAEFKAGGTSTKHKIDYLKECQSIVSQDYPQSKTHYQRQILYAKLVAWIEKLLPRRLFEFLMRMKNNFLKLQSLKNNKAKTPI
jgi:glycosyltransferase involved in cell wall biosynthesis